jgi:hypothetical protein
MQPDGILISDGGNVSSIIRRAVAEDVEAIADLAEQKRIQYEKYQPVFHRRAENARKNHGEFLKFLITKEDVIVLVAGNPGAVEGFIYANIVGAPPVYNPGGKVCMVDDFVVSRPELWPSTGKVLLEQMNLEAQKVGAVLGNVVCGPLDTPKRSMLQAFGYSVASEWFVKPLPRES